MGSETATAGLLNNIGIVYFYQNNYALALEYFKRSMALREQQGDVPGHVEALVNIGNIYLLQKDYDQALANYNRSLALVKDKLMTAEVLGQIGAALDSKGSYAEALNYLRRGLEISESEKDQPNVAVIRAEIAQLFYNQKDYERSLEAAEQAADVARQIAEPERIWAALSIAGKACMALGRLDQARQRFEQAIAAIESVRADLGGGEQGQQGFFEGKILPYQRMVDLLVAEHKPDEALAFAERAKARVLLDVLSSGRINITKAMTTEEQQQEQSLNYKIASVNALIARENSAARPDEPRLADLKNRLQKARLEREEFQINLYTAHPELKLKRGQTQPLNLDAAAELLPDQKTALLEYVVADERTFLLVVTRKGGQQTHASAALQAYSIDIKQEDLSGRVERFRRRLAEHDLDFRNEATELFRRRPHLRTNLCSTIAPAANATGFSRNAAAFGDCCDCERQESNPHSHSSSSFFQLARPCLWPRR